MADWNNPQNASLYTDVMQMIKERDYAAMTLNSVAETFTNLPDGAMKWHPGNQRLERMLSGVWQPQLMGLGGGGTGANSAAGARNNLGLGAVAVENVLTVAKGGTEATTAAGARTNLGLGSMSTQNGNAVSITGGSISGIAALGIAVGGTGANSIIGARANLGLGGLAILHAVGVGEIWDGNVTTAKLADGAVTTAKIADGQVTDAKIASGLNGKGSRIVSTGTPSGGNNGDIWYQV